MPAITRFEDIVAWRKARELARCVYEASSDGAWAKDFALRDQIRRAAISVVSNIAEGFERDGNREFRQFLAIAKGSTGEVKAQLYVAFDAQFLTEQRFRQLYDLATETGRLIGGFIRYLTESAMRGAKYRELRELGFEYVVVAEDSELEARDSELGS